ncbi:MAG: RnfABCDGE type electron transport complex subunit G [Eubacteriales bacterium]
MKNLIKDALVLFAITLIAGLVLGVVYEVTKDPIAEQEMKAKTAASMEVFPTATNFDEIEVEVSDQVRAGLDAAGLDQEDVVAVYVAEDGSGNVLGFVLNMVTHAGYSGDITFAMGIMTDGTVNGISLLSIAETPGLGMEAEEVLQPQFANKKVSEFMYTKTGASSDMEIDAISGATITTSALTNGVNAGLYYFEEVLGGYSHE